MNNSVFDILIYVFDRYMLEELPASERSTLARDLESAGFGEDNVERALDWLADLADERERPVPRTDGSFRVFVPEELARLDVRCRGLLASLEAGGILSPELSARSSSTGCWRSMPMIWIWITSNGLC